ncbi:MAG: DUF4168 domain-containing protein [Calothrix sp. C42_A2020_038]|nr:DUF4168 domain-containing protein [Calothrix sp. C42_A2020_038]
MLKLHSSLLKQERTKVLHQPSLVSSLTAITLLAGTFIFGSKAYAQNQAVNSTEIVNYAKAVLAMEAPRQQAFDEIKKIIGNSEVPKITCNDPNSFNALPGRAKNIAVDYCNRSQKIVEENGFSIDRFNEVTVQMQSDQGLQKRIYNQLIILQKRPGS